MTSTTPMTREELLELAALDAFGLLDEYEAALFTRSFHHAPAAVQDEIKQLQAAFAADEALLPATEPDPQLRQRVLRAVSQAIDAESIELAPLAMIGRSRGRERDGAGRTGVGVASLLWRAAAFTLAGAVLVMAYFVLTLNQETDKLHDIVIDLATTSQVESLAGRDFFEFAENPSCVRIALTSTDPDVVRNAVLYVNEETEEAFLFTVNLPEQAVFTLTGDPNGANPIDKDFESNGAVCGVHLELTAVATALASTTLWQITDATGAVLLSSA